MRNGLLIDTVTSAEPSERPAVGKADKALSSQAEAVLNPPGRLVQAFLLTTEGVVLRRAARGPPAAAPWLVFKRGGWGGAFKLIGRLPQRPDAEVCRLASTCYAEGGSCWTEAVWDVSGCPGHE